MIRIRVFPIRFCVGLDNNNHFQITENSLDRDNELANETSPFMTNSATQKNPPDDFGEGLFPSW